MKTLISLLTLVSLFPLPAMAVATHARMKAKLNQNIVPSDGNLFRLGDQFTNKKVQVMKVTFDASLTGATGYPLKYVGTHSMRDVDGTSATIPSGALVKEAWIDITNTVLANSAAPRLCFQIQSECDLKSGQTSQAYQTNGTTSFRQILPVDGNTVMRLTADRIVKAVVTGGALTGGTMNLFIEYFLP
jgi:hypothetical protein